MNRLVNYYEKQNGNLFSCCSQDMNQEFYTEEKCYITELSNSSADDELSIARYYILQRQGKVELGDLEPQLVTLGDTVIIPPQCPQRIENTGTEDLIFWAICTPPFKGENYVDIDDLKMGN